MSYLILSVIVIGLSYFYEKMKKEDKLTKSTSLCIFWAIGLLLCLFAGLRTAYNDTYLYIATFKKTPSDISEIFAGEFYLSNIYLFKLWDYFVYHVITHDANVYLFLSAFVFVFPALHLINKYSKNFTFSMIIFMFGGMYLFSLAGVKQAMATGVLLMGVPSLFKKKYFKYYLFCFIAMGFHTYSIFFMILPLLGEDIFNRKTLWFCAGVVVVGLFLSYFTGVITAIINFLGKDLSGELIQKGSVNGLRALAFLVPFVLTFMSGKKLDNLSVQEKVFIKMGMLSSIFMVLALFGNPILFGRIPQYFLIGMVITLPLLIENTFVKVEREAVVCIAIICYVLFGVYSLYVDSAFSQDIFKLIWFYKG